MRVALDTIVSMEDIQRGLRAVGVGSGDCVFVHSSLKSFGHVNGGADAVIDSLLRTVGPRGTVVMPTFTWRRFHNQDHVVFDIVNTPSETGAITEAFRRRETAVRSRHLCHSVAAIGAQAANVMGNGASPFGKGSSFEQLHELNALILLLGVDFRVCTALHRAEELMKVPYRFFKHFPDSHVILPSGQEVRSHSVEFLRKPGYQNDFGKMNGVFEKSSELRKTEVGRAGVMSIPMRDVLRITLAHLDRDIHFLLKDQITSDREGL